MEQRVVRVKFVDRTFNCDRQRARAIWRHLMERDNGVKMCIRDSLDSA